MREHMQPAIKAALLSAFVLPGLGQIYLKRYWRGIIIMLLVLSAIGVIIVSVTMSTLENLKKMQSQGTVDMSALSNLTQITSTEHAAYYNVVLILAACCWLFSIIDAYVIGKRGVGT